MSQVYVWTGVLEDFEPHTIHFWYRDASGVALRLCDGDTVSTAPEPASEYCHFLPCETCENLYVNDLTTGACRLELLAPDYPSMALS